MAGSDCMALRVLYLVFLRLLGLLLLLSRSEEGKDVELLALRHPSPAQQIHRRDVLNGVIHEYRNAA